MTKELVEWMKKTVRNNQLTEWKNNQTVKWTKERQSATHSLTYRGIMTSRQDSIITKQRFHSPIESKSTEFATDFLSSTAIAFSNACRWTIFLHSVYLRRASLSLGLNFFTYREDIIMSETKLKHTRHLYNTSFR